MLDTQTIINLAWETGFAAAGITSPVLPETVTARFMQWLKAGYHGEMDWLQKNAVERSDLRKRFPWVNSVLVVADYYYQPQRWNPAFPKISRYAWGQDYHRIVRDKLTLLLQQLQSIETELQGQIYVDAGPVLEKAFAVQAGLGWQGKHSLVIVAGYGSFCFLGILLLNQTFTRSQPIPDRCGNCLLCVDHCPTGALIEPGILDARKCISYLTVEKRSALTAGERQSLQGYLYGCDICQDECPWNQKQPAGPPDPCYGSQKTSLERLLPEWQQLSAAEFGDLFQHSAVKRLTFQGWQRNVDALAGSIES
jgi:epoxyqueuosine reductase